MEIEKEWERKTEVEVEMLVIVYGKILVSVRISCTTQAEIQGRG